MLLNRKSTYASYSDYILTFHKNIGKEFFISNSEQFEDVKGANKSPLKESQ
jgi:hypothetical protein